MDLNKVKEKWKSFTADMNKRGVPLPTVRDPKTGLGSISLTLTFISFNVVLIGLVGKWAGALGGIDLTQALNLFYACAALYWGRKFQGGGSSLGDVDPQQPVPQQSSGQQKQSPPASKPQTPAVAPKSQQVDNPD
jgi:hypothetical protein